MQDLSALLTPQRQAHIYATGFTAIIILGTLSLLAIGMAVLWLVVQFTLLLCTSVLASCNELASTFASADPLVKVLFLMAIGFAVYRAGQWLARRIK